MRAAAVLPHLAVLLLAGCSSLERVDLVVDGTARNAFLHVPADLPEAPPLLLAFHGGGPFGDAKGRRMAAFTGLAEVAEAEGFAVAFPSADGGSWSDGPGQGPDDLAFVDALVGELAQRVPGLDRQRVYAAGFSNGGFFALRVACERPDLVAAVASVSGGMLEGYRCGEGSPVAVMIAGGTADRVVPLDGGAVAGDADTVALPWEQVVDSWTTRLGCEAPPAELQGDPAEDGTWADVRSWTDCDAGTAVEAIRVVGGGHQWPGGTPVAPEVIAGPVPSGWDASQAVWDFVSRFTHPAH